LPVPVVLVVLAVSAVPVALAVLVALHLARLVPRWAVPAAQAHKVALAAVVL
jgi:hypothetical protein